MGFPSIVGQILAGMIFGIPLIKTLLFDSEALIALDVLSTLGIVFLLFLAGLEIEMRFLKETALTSIIIGVAATVTPLLLGFFLLLAFGYSLTVALVFGIVLSVTAGGTIIGILMDLNAVNTRLGAILVAAGTVDDILEIFLLSFVTILIQGGSYVEIALLPAQLALFIAVAFILFKGLEKVLPYIRARAISDASNIELFSVALIILIGMSALSESLSIGYLIGAILAGFLLQNSLKKVGRKNKIEMVKTTRLIALAFVVPFFFANIGLNFNVALLLENPILIIAASLIAIGGAIIGAVLTKPLSRLSFRQLYVVGWAMSSKGSVDVVVALLAQKYGLLPPEIFSAVVAMAIIVTLTFPFVLKREIHRNRSILN
jgi:Kef-type K+ transport system membrane component KefB